MRRDQELVELAAAVGTAMAERRVVEARPHAAPVRHDEEQAALGRQHAPHLAQELPRAVGDLEAMHGEQPVDGAVGERQAVVVHEHAVCEGASRGQRTAPWLSGISAPRCSASPRKAPRYGDGYARARSASSDASPRQRARMRCVSRRRTVCPSGVA